MALSHSSCSEYRQMPLDDASTALTHGIHTPAYAQPGYTRPVLEIVAYVRAFCSAPADIAQPFQVHAVARLAGLHLAWGWSPEIMHVIWSWNGAEHQMTRRSCDEDAVQMGTGHKHIVSALLPIWCNSVAHNLRERFGIQIDFCPGLRAAKLMS